MLPARRKIVRLIRYMPPEKLHRLLKFAEELDDELTPAEIDDVAAAKMEVAQGEWVSFDEIRRRENL